MAGRIVLVALISIISIGLWSPDIMRFLGHPLGTTGFTVDSTGAVTSVDRGSPAERAGIRPGQRIDFAATPLSSRILIVNTILQNLQPVQRFPVTVVGERGRFTTLVSTEPEPAADLATMLPRMAFSLILLAAGIALVMLRPGKATWAFFIFAAFNPGQPINWVIWFGPPVYQIAMTVLTGPSFAILSLMAAVIFALYLLVEPPIHRWRLITEASAYVVGLTVALLSSWSIVATTYFGAPAPNFNGIVLALELSATIAPIVLLFATYASSDAPTRERVRWVILGFSVNALDFVYYFVSQTVTAISPPYWLWSALAGLDSVVVTITVLYAVLKHHVIDVNVAISRALVYTILSALLVGIFALVDLLFSRMLSVRSAGLMVDVGLALVLGFTFNSIHSRVDRFVDRVLFRVRHAAEEHMKTVIRGLPFAVSQNQVDRLLIEEPVRSFTLTGAELLASSEDSPFECRSAFGAPFPGLSVIAREDSLPVYLQGERCALRLNKHGWDTHAIAIPVFSHGDLIAIAIYGLHENGTDLDNEEIELFQELAVAGGNAYDRLEAQYLRERLRQMLPTRG